MKDHKLSEKEGADDFLGQLVPFSGAGIEPLDFETGGKYDGYLVENKHTVRKSYSIQFDYFKAQERRARMVGKKFFLRIDNGKDEPIIGIRQSLFKEMFPNEES